MIIYLKLQVKETQMLLIRKESVFLSLAKAIS